MNVQEKMLISTILVEIYIQDYSFGIFVFHTVHTTVEFTLFIMFFLFFFGRPVWCRGCPWGLWDGPRRLVRSDKRHRCPQASSRFRPGGSGGGRARAPRSSAREALPSRAPPPPARPYVPGDSPGGLGAPRRHLKKNEKSTYRKL